MIQTTISKAFSGLLRAAPAGACLRQHREIPTFLCPSSTTAKRWACLSGTPRHKARVPNGSDNTQRFEGVASQSVTSGLLGHGSLSVSYRGIKSSVCLPQEGSRPPRPTQGPRLSVIARLDRPGAVDEGSAQSAGRHCRQVTRSVGTPSLGHLGLAKFVQSFSKATLSVLMAACALPPQGGGISPPQPKRILLCKIVARGPDKEDKAAA